MKTGLENDSFWSEIGSGFGEPGGTPPPEFPGVPPRVRSSSLAEIYVHK